MRFKSLRESLVHIERSFVLHRGVDQSGIQSGRGLIGLLAQISAHLPDLIAIEIDSGHTFDIAAVGDLIALVVEPIADSTVRDQNLTIAQAGHVAEQSGDLLTFPIEALIEKLNSGWSGGPTEVSFAKRYPEVTLTNIAAVLDSHPTVTYNNNALPMRRIGQR